MVSKQQKRRSTSALREGRRRSMNRNGLLIVHEPGKRTIRKGGGTAFRAVVTRRRDSNQPCGNDGENADAWGRRRKARFLPARFPAPRMTKRCRGGQFGKNIAGAQDMQMSAASAVLMQHEGLAHCASRGHRKDQGPGQQHSSRPGETGAKYVHRKPLSASVPEDARKRVPRSARTLRSRSAILPRQTRLCKSYARRTPPATDLNDVRNWWDAGRRSAAQ